LKEAHFTAHSLRNSFALFLLAKGVHPKVVAEVLGHSSITITMDVYSKIIPGPKEMAMEQLRDFWVSGSLDLRRFLVRPAGVEPSTCGLGDRCSIL